MKNALLKAATASLVGLALATSAHAQESGGKQAAE
jgi:hypothetical protein